MRRTSSLLWIGVVSGLLLAGPGGLLADVPTPGSRGPECPDAEDKARDEGRAVMVKLATERESYRVGDVVPLAIVVVSREEEQELSFRTSQRFDVSATREGEVLWRWSADRVFLMALGWEAFLRGDPTVHVITWDLRDDEGECVPPGEYELQAVLTAEEAVHSKPITIHVEPQAHER